MYVNKVLTGQYQQEWLKLCETVLNSINMLSASRKYVNISPLEEKQSPNPSCVWGEENHAGLKVEF